jgi:hypothetical protein
MGPEKPRGRDVDRRACFDNVRHHVLVAKVAQRRNDAAVMQVLQSLLQAAGSQGVPPGGGSPRCAGIGPARTWSGGWSGPPRSPGAARPRRAQTRAVPMLSCLGSRPPATMRGGCRRSTHAAARHGRSVQSPSMRTSAGRSPWPPGQPSASWALPCDASRAAEGSGVRGPRRGRRSGPRSCVSCRTYAGATIPHRWLGAATCSPLCYGDGCATVPWETPPDAWAFAKPGWQSRCGGI